MSEPRTILVVDDEPDAIEFVKTVISEAGDFVTLSAKDGVSGLAKAREAKPDLVILDVQMPGMDGFAVFHDMKRNPSTANIPVIMLTGVADKVGIGFSSEAMEKYFGHEPEAYIEKPVDPEVLKKTILQVLGD